MALLLGELTFESLEAAWKALPGPGDRENLALLLEELHRRGQITAESLQSLRVQVADLERILVCDTSTSQQDANTVERMGPATRRVPTERRGRSNVPLPPALAGPESRGPGAAQDVNRNLLSILTLPRWNQYINLKFVGEGGMGRIFRAFDPTLNRAVALKFLRHVDIATVNDLVQEARNQAQVNHPNICKVFEVKEWNGQFYVAMQFIDGRTLDLVAAELTLVEKLEIMETVAEAVHAAHRLGLVHRDLKPTNVMVERTAEGVLTPYVLDFGLARDMGKLSDTLDGTILGTLHYMAPEQARGEMSLIGRRTDVYGLGVTLYELLTGAPPFKGIQGMDCLRYILEVPIPPLRSVVSGLHADLETIVMKCLEKEPALRYDSARALSEDLRRYRDGEPILARRPTLLYRSGKWARKHKGIMVLGAVALVVVLLFAGLGLRANWTAASQAQWAQHFGQEAERIESLLRYARLQPTHDIRGELATVRARIRAMEHELQGVGGRAQGPGNYALGRAYLALGEVDQARAFLDRAWQAGFRVKDVSYARGRALGQDYAQALQKARTLQDPFLRQARILELEETLRDPAVALLRQGRGSMLEPARFQEGLLALYDRQYSDTLQAARDAAQSAPWFYEARALEAEVFLEQARLAKDPAATLALLDQAGGALASAALTAPSDPTLCDLQSRRWWEEMIQRRRSGRPLQEAFLAFEAACLRWKTILPGTPDAEARLAWGDLERARGLGLAPAAREAGFQRAIGRAEAVLRTHPGFPEALGVLAAALQLQGYADLNNGRDPSATLDRAIRLLQQALGADSAAFELFEPYAASYWAKVEFQKSRGQDPAAAVQQALEAIRLLARRYPRVADFEGFMGGIQVEWADFQANHGIDPGPVATRALANLERASRMVPTRFDFHYSQGNAHLAQAQYRFLTGQPVAAALAAAEAAYRAALECNASASGALLGLGEVGLLRSQELQGQGRSPLATLAQAESSMIAAQAFVDNWRLPLFHAQAALVRARWFQEPAEVRQQLVMAEREAAVALTLGGKLPTLLLVAAEVQLTWARLLPLEAKGRLERARRGLEEALRQDPSFGPGLKLAAELKALD